MHVYCSYNSIYRVGHSDDLVSGIHRDTVSPLAPGCVSIGKTCIGLELMSFLTTCSTYMHGFYGILDYAGPYTRLQSICTYTETVLE